MTAAMAAVAATRVRTASVATPAVSGTATPLPGVGQGIDISSHNAEPNWTALKQGGVSFVGIKATEGDYYVNTATTTPVRQPGYATEVTDATAAGMHVMPYAFANPYQGDGTTAHPGHGSGTYQADYAWQVISSVTSPSYSSSSRLSHKTPVLYTNPNFWSVCTGNSTAFSSYPLWLADYGIASPPRCPGGAVRRCGSTPAGEPSPARLAPSTRTTSPRSSRAPRRASR